ncbi:efflux transporter outer membrane subunit [Bombella pollinis]|uniref:Efflux transporter outer membrane subunit n=1 Tax=Bombella pollinis TaxID=2967337 RepID=A0ABT3WJ13_9PROT|nr:efflux transporter outer membrane subunit [Bombella pollinis]MCX5619089.1 efflux transporter outer membrane subunit [Bombella pollinis]
MTTPLHQSQRPHKGQRNPLLRACSTLALLAVGLGGCIVGPSPKDIPPLPDKTDYTKKPITQTAGGNNAAKDSLLRRQHFTAGADVAGKWWEAFQNPQLNQLIEQALANSPTLKAQQAGLKAAWEQRRVEGASLYPSVSAQFLPTRNKTSKALSPVPNNNEWLYNLHTAQLNIGYVPDLWGGSRLAIRNAKAQADIQRFQLEATTLTLISNLVNTAITEAGLRAQIRAKEMLIAQQTAMLTINGNQVGLGDQSRQSHLLLRDSLAQLQADLPPLQTQLAQTRDQLATLAGLTPNADLPTFELKDFTLPEELPLSLPAQLILQRPDVAAAQAQIRSAGAQLGIAIANRLPNVQLSALPGEAVNSMSQLFKPGMGNWMLAATVTQPIFQGGSLLHAQREAKANYTQAKEYYQAAILSAVGDVADSLHAVDLDSKTLMADQSGLEAATQALRIAETQHRLGDNSKIDLAQARMEVAQDELSVAQDKVTRLSDTVGLFQSLGGGWWNRNDLGVSRKEADHLSTTLVPW